MKGDRFILQPDYRLLNTESYCSSLSFIFHTDCSLFSLSFVAINSGAVKKRFWVSGVGLLFCLFIYLFYRTERTVVNQMAITVFSPSGFRAVKEWVNGVLPLHEFIVYSLPGGVWVMSATLLSASLFVRLGSTRIQLVLVPFVFAVGLEWLQFAHLVAGRFDWSDLLLYIFFWGLGLLLTRKKESPAHLFSPFTLRSAICIFSYAIVLLAHVVMSYEGH